MDNWFEVSKDGLSRLVERRGPHWILGELLQNAWDAPGVTLVSVRVTPGGRGRTEVLVEDDSPVGFADLSHAFTLFADSSKKGDPNLRGRFNLGEKLVLSLCDEATISTPKGTVSFGPKGRRNERSRRMRGTAFRGLLRLNRVDADIALEAVKAFISPTDIRTLVNDVELEPREGLRTFEAILTTEIADAEGRLRKTKRKTVVTLYRPLRGAPGRVYEMGIPVCETGDQFDVDVGQKVPLGFERDTLLPAFLRELRVAIVNNALDDVEAAELSSDWVRHALGSEGIRPDVAGRIVTRRFGEKVVSFDPSDREANDRATAAGYAVLHGSTFSKGEWTNVRTSGVIRPAGQVTPTPRPFSPDGEPAQDVSPTPAMLRFRRFVRRLAREIAATDVDVRFLRRFNAAAAYGNGIMSFNIGLLRTKWFEGPLRQEQIDLVIHELGHEFEGNHLSKNFNDALTRLGARAVMLALEKPVVFDLSSYEAVGELVGEA